MCLFTTAIVRLSFILSDYIWNFIQASYLIRFSIYLENSSFIFIALLIVVAFFVLIWRRYYIIINENLGFFFWILLGFVLSIMLLITRRRFLSLFIGWEGLGVTSFLLVIFYQNWNRLNGGLLTLLTNRLGDVILIITLCTWLCSNSFRLVRASFICIALVLLSFTKSAQWPFSSWLPAAIAAPTPVRALVHSSTLVTAGVWLLFRFLIIRHATSRVILAIGGLTLLVARIAALLETDAKKIVALSTLRQLGLIVMAFFLGNKRRMLFHLVAHALAKANLFIAVGIIIHETASQQRTRSLRRISFSFLRIEIIVRVISLSGLRFFSGIISKEEILKTHYSFISRVASLLFIAFIVFLTLAYCLKLLNGLIMRRLKIAPKSRRITNVTPTLILRALTIFWSSSYGNNTLFMPQQVIAFNAYIILRGLVLVALRLTTSFLVGFYLNEVKAKLIPQISLKKFKYLTSRSLIFESLILSFTLKRKGAFTTPSSMLLRRVVLMALLFF